MQPGVIPSQFLHYQNAAGNHHPMLISQQPSGTTTVSATGMQTAGAHNAATVVASGDGNQQPRVMLMTSSDLSSLYPPGAVMLPGSAPPASNMQPYGTVIYPGGTSAVATAAATVVSPAQTHQFLAQSSSSAAPVKQEPPLPKVRCVLVLLRQLSSFDVDVSRSFRP